MVKNRGGKGKSKDSPERADKISKQKKENKMNKLKLFISVSICSILLTGCSFIAELFGKSSSGSKKTSSSSTATTRQVERGSDCVPADLMDRLVTYSSRGNTIYAKVFDSYFKDLVDESKCDEWGIEHYKEVVSKEKYLPFTWELEERFQKKWDICNTMPKWLNTKLNEYIEQNKNDDKAYIDTSKFKESWQTIIGLMERQHISLITKVLKVKVLLKENQIVKPLK